MGLIPLHFDETGEAQILADELRSENERMQGEIDRLREDVQQFSNAMEQIRFVLNRIHQLLAAQAKRRYEDAQAEEYETGDTLRDIQNQINII